MATPPNYLQLAQSRPNPYAADAINQASAFNTLSFQKQEQAKKEREYRRDWWKRGLGKGAMGALQGGLTGLMTGNPLAAGAGAAAGFAGGFGGEALNHAAFEDQNPAMGNAGASLGALAGRGVGGYMNRGSASAGGDGGIGEIQQSRLGGNITYDQYRQLMLDQYGGGPF